MNKDVESLILMKLDDEDLERIGKYISKRVYEDDMFWKRRTVINYPEIVEYKHKYSKSWKEYYNSIKTFVNNIYDDNVQNYIDRDDFIDLTRRFEKNFNKILTSVNERNEDWKIIIMKNDCNPNIFYQLFYKLKDDKTSEKYVSDALKYLINLKDKRIRLSSLLFEWIFIRSDNMREILELVLKDSRVNVETIEKVLTKIRKFRRINSKILNLYLDFVEKNLLPTDYNIFLRKLIGWMQE